MGAVHKIGDIIGTKRIISREGSNKHRQALWFVECVKCTTVSGPITVSYLAQKNACQICSRYGGVPPKDPSDIDVILVAWLAGILEGEGSFLLSRDTVGGKVYFYPRIVVNMSDRDIIERVGTLFCTSVYDLPPDKRGATLKPMFRVSIQGTRAVAFMRVLLPFMGQRRSAKIREIIAYTENLESTEVRRQRSCQDSYKERVLDKQTQ